jgi:hypothetical protein
MLLGRDPLAGLDLVSQPLLSRFENAAGPRPLYRMGEELAASVIERHGKWLEGATPSGLPSIWTRPTIPPASACCALGSILRAKRSRPSMAFTTGSTAGLVEEMRGLLARYGLVKALDSLGYKQARGVLDGSMSVEDAIKAAQQGHRNYAKRQMTWFRREPAVHWIEGFGDEA